MQLLPKYLSLFVLFSLLFIGGSVAIRSQGPQDWDSLIYHLPIAKNFLENGNIFPDWDKPFTFYPANIHVFLSLFLLISSSWFLNIFNLVGILLLFLASFFLGKLYLKKETLVYLYVIVITTITPVLRLISTQMIDVWSLAFFTYGIGFLFCVPSKKHAYLMSLCLGIFAGAKYNHFFILLFLFILFYNRIKFLWIDKLSIVLFFVPAFVWHFRNLLLTGNPFYPANIEMLHLSGDLTIEHLMSSSPLSGIISQPHTILLLINALFSNFHIWIFLIPILPFFTYKNLKTTKLIIASFGVCLLYFITPAFIENAYHDLRYMLPGIVILILVFFYRFRNYPALLYGVIFAQCIIAFSFFPYQPKAIVGGLLVTLVIYAILERKRIDIKIR